ncbi:MAG: hypothetical protein ABSD89_13175, partial [Halobacteriota archaeon]
EADQLREDGTALVHEPLSAVPGAQTSCSNIQIAASSKQTQLITGPSFTVGAPCFSRTVVIYTVGPGYHAALASCSSRTAPNQKIDSRLSWKELTGRHATGGACVATGCQSRSALKSREGKSRSDS